MFSCVIYALIIGWKLALVFLSISPVIVLIFNVTIKVSEQQKCPSDTHAEPKSFFSSGHRPIHDERGRSLCIGISDRSRSLAEHSHGHGLSWSTEGREEVGFLRCSSNTTRRSFRFAKNLVQAKNIGVRKGFFMGICQGSNQILFFLALTLIFW